MSEAAKRQPFLAHIQELRGRLAWCVVALLIGTAIGYLVKDELLALLIAPLGQTIYYTSPGGGFSLLIQLCLSFGIVFSVPVIIFHAIRFVAPIVPGYSLRFLLTTLTASCALVAIGVAFAYFVSLPAALYFLNEFSTEQVQALITTDTYMSFVTLYLAGFAVLFQLPLILLIINNVTRLRPKKLLAATKWVILGSFIAAALITPTPDPFNQAIMAGPIILLYLLSIFLVTLVNRSQSNEPSKDEEIEVLVLTDQEEVSTSDSFDTSELEEAHRQQAVYKGKPGEYVMWKRRDGSSDEIIVTFLFEDTHTFIKSYRLGELRKPVDND